MIRKTLSSVFASAFALLSFAGPSAQVPSLFPDGVVGRAELQSEIQVKLARVHEFLVQQHLQGMLLTRVDNFTWITAGLADNMIVTTSEIGAASLLIMLDGRRFLVANNSETPRLMREELAELGYQSLQYEWYDEAAGRLRAVQGAAHGGPIGTDVPVGDLKPEAAEFAPLRFQLTESEVKKYRWVGRNATQAVIAVCRKLQLQDSERDLAAMASDELMQRGLQPTVLLMGVDHRVSDYHHHTPTDLKLSKYAIVNVCARRWGLVASVARFVHFGPLEPELARKLEAAMQISAKYQAHSKPGVTGGQMIAWAKNWFEQAGFPGYWQDHHQGGAIGYAEREWIAAPGSTEAIHDHQAFAWNPIVRGALSFDTIIVYTDHIENITTTSDWPVTPVTIDGVRYDMPGILVR